MKKTHNPPLLYSSDKLYRYYKTDYFIDLLEKEQIYACRVDLFGDDHEGSFPTGGISYRQETFEKLGFQEKLIKTIQNQSFSFRKTCYAICLNQANHENIALWERYSSSMNGICIVISAEKFIESFNELKPTYFGRVVYYDYESDAWETGVQIEETGEIISASDLGGGFRALMSKRQEYKDEKEVRALFWLPVITNNQLDYVATGKIPGKHIPINLKSLIQEVILGSGISENDATTIKELLNKKVPSCIIRKSSLDKKPCF